MSIRRTIVLAVVLSMSFANAVLAARLTTPRPVLPAEGFFAATSSLSGVSALSAGKPSGLALGPTWVTSDYMPDDFTTYAYWCDFESLAVVGIFSTLKGKNVTARLTVRDQDGAQVFSDSYTEAPLPGAILGRVFQIGDLAEGLYKVTYQFKQGTTVVGQSYWIYVLSGADPACSP